MARQLMRTPRSVDIEITTKCNLRCKYCSHFSSGGDVDYDLPKEEWLQFFNELRKCHVMYIELLGGEPFFRKDFKDIIDGIVNNKMRFSILSNGGLITDEIAAFLKSTRRCDYIQVSIDGSTSSIHDSFRGKGSFDKAAEGIKTLKKHRLGIMSRVTIHKQNVHDIENTARLLLDELQVPSISFNSALYMGTCRQDANNIQLDIEEHELAMNTLMELKIKYNRRISSTSGPLTDAIFWTGMVRALREKKEAFPNCGFFSACGCVNSKMGVRADGVMVPCVQMGHIEMGRINKDKLVDVWQHNPEINRIRNRRFIPLSDSTYCKGCEYMSYCTGNCPSVAYNIHGNDQQPNLEACLRRYLNAGGKLPDEYLFEKITQLD